MEDVKTFSPTYSAILTTEKFPSKEYFVRSENEIRRIVIIMMKGVKNRFDDFSPSTPSQTMTFETTIADKDRTGNEIDEKKEEQRLSSAESIPAARTRSLIYKSGFEYKNHFDPT